MKKFSKALLSIAAVSAVSAAMAASAMAMTATYNGSDGVGTVSINDVGNNGTSQTLMIFKGDNTTTIDSSNANELVKQIDQADSADDTPAAVVKNGKVVVGQLEKGQKYTVRIAGTEGTMQVAEFTVPEDGGDIEYEQIVLGDVDSMPGIGLSDAGAIASYVSNINNITNTKVGTIRRDADGNEITIGDIDTMSGIGLSDAGAIASYVSNINNITNTKVGTTVSVEKQ